MFNVFPDLKLKFCFLGAYLLRIQSQDCGYPTHIIYVHLVYIIKTNFEFLF